MKWIFGVLLGALIASSAQAGSKSTTHSWFAPWSASDANMRQYNLNAAIANKQAEDGTLGLPGDTTVFNQNITNIGTAIEVQNGSGSVDLDAEQNTNIGSQSGSITSTTNAGAGSFETGNFINLD